MDEYTLGVLKAEVGSDATTPSWHIQALMGLAVTIRSYTWTHGAAQPDGTFEMGSTTNAQTFFPEKSTGQNYPNAVAQTTGQYLYHPDGEGAARVITANYSRQHGPNAGTFYTVDGGKPYLKSIYDPILGDIPGSKGHGWGLAQLGAYYWAIGQDNQGKVFPQLNYLEILTHYFTGVQVKNANTGNTLTPTHRWVPLRATWNGNSTPPTLSPGVGSVVTVQLQNTGVVAFPANIQLSCQWRKPDGDVVDCLSSDRANPDTLNPGATNTVELRVTPYSDFTPGVYTLRLDLKIGAQYFHDWEAPEQPWFTQDVVVTIGPAGGGQTNDLFLPLVFRSDAPPPSLTCVWTIDNLFENGGFNNLAQPYWQELNVFDTNNPNQVPQPLSTLITKENFLPGDGPWSVKLGGVNDPNNSHTAYEHAVFQAVRMNQGGFPKHIEKVAIEFSYYLTTQDVATGDWDKFYVDLRVNGLGPNNSILPGPIVFSNRFPYQNEWRRIGPDEEDSFQVENMGQYAGDAVYLVFYSEVDEGWPTTFYLDAVKLKGCVSN